MARQRPLHTAGLALACSVLLAAAGLAAATKAATGLETAPRIALNRFGRQLKQVEAPLSSYLLPTQAPSFCSGASCCQEDDYTSPYHIMMLNSTKATFGGRTYTTFFMNVMRSYTCEQAVDFAGCCNANISAIWIDVDPSLKVSFATLSGKPTAATPVQDSYGFRLVLNAQLEPVATLISVTVEGSVNSLCPTPSLLGLDIGLCDVIVEGGVPSNPGACCPRGLSIPSSVANWVPPSNYFQCVSDVASSPFNLTLDSVSDTFQDSAATRAANYSLTLRRASFCREGPNSCCGMDIDYLMLKVLAGTEVTSLTFNGAQKKFSMAPWNEEGQAGYKALMVEGLNYHVEDVPDAGIKLTVSVRVANNAAAIPQLCSQPADSTTYGACAFYLHSGDGFCCPAGSTFGVSGPGSNPGGPTGAPPPPVLPGTCDPQYSVSISDTSMTFSYYEYTSSPTDTEFVFLITDTNGPTCNNKAFCTDVCGWSLAVNDAITPTLMFVADDPANDGKEIVTRGPQAAVNFIYGPSGTQSITYTIKAPAGTPLESLCRPNAYPDQGSWPCAAMVKSTSNIYSLVFFSQDSVFIKNYPSPPVSPGVCDLSRPLTDSCMRVTSFRYNSPDSSSTVFDFTVNNTDPAASGCVIDESVQFRVMLQAPFTDELSGNAELLPQSTALFNSLTGVTWTWTPPAVDMSAHYSFNVHGAQTPGSVCVQNMPGQPANTCPVQFEGKTQCFIGYMSAIHDTSLIWVSPSAGSSSSSSRAGVIAPAVAVPLAVLLLLAIIAAVLYRRKKQQEHEGASGSGASSGDLAAPLTSGPASGDDQAGPHRSGASAASAAASDVQIRL